MASFGKLGEYNGEKESISNYIERLEQFFSANGTRDEKRVPMLLSVIGAESYGVLRNLVQPDLPKDKSYADLVKTLTDHYMPKPLVISERYKFNKRNQRDGERIMDYVVVLKKLATYCEFNAFLNDALRDRLVCGLRSEVIQRKLLSEDGLTFEKACQIACAIEMAEKDTASFQPQGRVSEVNVVHKGKSGKKVYYKREKNSNKGESKPCFRCGEDHTPGTCRFKNSKCFTCTKVGHIAKVCMSTKREKQTRYLDESSDDSEMNGVFITSTKGKSQKIILQPVVGKSVIPMELDTGSAVSIISEESYDECLSDYPLIKTDINLKSYSGNKINVCGKCQIPVELNGEKYHNLPLYVAKGKRPALFGRNWLVKIPLNWSEIFSVQKVAREISLESVKNEFKDLWKIDDSQLSSPIKGFKAKIRMKDGATPIFCKARPVPYAIKELVEKGFERMEKEGIVYRVKHSEWATPLVVVPKPDTNSVRLCGDYKVTVNREISEEQYPIPNTEDLFATLAGGQKFTKLDLSQAYLQLELDTESEELLTVNTHMGLFRYRRLVYGVSSSPAIFQAVMDKILTGIPNVVCRIDDILITGQNDKTHLSNLHEVLKRLSEHNIQLKLEKCSWMQDEVIYMGHLVNKHGLQATQDKIDAVKNCQNPENVSQLRSYLGLIGYYRSFLPNLATVLYPLHNLLKKGEIWTWTDECEESFNRSRELVINSGLSVHYDMKKPVTLACDSSSYGLGAVLSHIMDDGRERPIAFASRTLTDSEKNYSQIHKEALSIIFGVSKFHKYLYGRKFTLITDHKSLTTILGPKKGVPTMAAARLQRWAVTLSAYDYNIVYRKSGDHANCDFLSRLPIKDNSIAREEEEETVSFIEDIPISARDIAENTRKHPILSKVYEYTMNGWPSHVSRDCLKPYFSRRNELSTDNGVILWGLRVVIPDGFTERILGELHEEHIGICRMKALARSYVWWPNIDADIERMVKSCATCMSVQNSPPTAPLHPWKWSTRPWQRIHIDFAEFKQQNFLVVIDSYSKWLEVIPMKSTTSAKTMVKLRQLFSSWGLPEELVSDNDPRFTSHEFKEFMEGNAIKHTLVPAYHPSSNGAAERAVQVLKKVLKKQLFDKVHRGHHDSVQFRLSKFLLHYRNTPHSTTKESPAVLFLKRQLRTRLTVLKPNKATDIEKKQESMKDSHDKRHTTYRAFVNGDTVLVKTILPGGKKWKWIPGIIHKIKGPVTYLVKVDTKIRYCHADHLRKNEAMFPENYEQTNIELPFTVPQLPCEEGRENHGSSQDKQNTSEYIPPGNSQIPTNGDIRNSTPAINNELLIRRYPTRVRKPPDRLTL